VHLFLQSQEHIGIVLEILAEAMESIIICLLSSLLRYRSGLFRESFMESYAMIKESYTMIKKTEVEIFA